MRCLYCGKELALLKRLTWGGDFCSEAHKNSYQEEYNRLALSRLLQAQKKGSQAGNSQSQKANPQPAIAVETSAPPVEVMAAQAANGAAIGAVAIEEASAEAAVDTEISLGTEGEPTETAGFLLESPVIAAPAEDTPYLEPWLEPGGGPLASRSASSVSAGASRTNRLPAGYAVAMEIAPSSVATRVEGSFPEAVGFEDEVPVYSSPLWELSLTGIEFPAEDSGVVLVAQNHEPIVAAREEAPALEETEPEPAIVETAEEESKAGPARDLFEISLKIFGPGKPALIGGDAFPSQTAPVLPHLKSLPRRPKFALAAGYVSPPVAPPADLKPATVPAQPETAVAPKAVEVERPEAEKAQAVTTPKVKRNAPQPVQKVKVKPAAAPPEAATSAKTPAKTSEGKTAEVKPAEPKPATQVVAAAIPTFGATQAPSGSFTSSLKVKLGIAIVLVVAACSTYLGWGGKSSKVKKSEAEFSADASGPNVVTGEGGWIEGWGHDPSGMHGGRQITIYRPSLKLADYRLYLEGRIETNSLGWVFRAADPDNYYAMKLVKGSSSATSSVSLFRYRIVNGRQTQAGRVPTDLTARPDTVFRIRVDVRGSQFTTYIQGQQIDVWTDDQLKIGGVGFLNEREERGTVKSVSIHSLISGNK